jgi:periplasmic protein TonB
VLARESIRRWSLAFGLTALIHVGLVYLLSGHSWMARSWPILLTELVEHPRTPAPRDEPRPAPVRRAPLEPWSLRAAPRSLDTRSLNEPVRQEASKPPEPVTDSSPAPIRSLDTTAPLPSSVTTDPAVHPMNNRADASREAGSGSPAGSTSVASTSGGSGLPTRPGPSSGTSTDGITRWARPQGGYQVYPDYPATARRSRIQGTTRLRVQVLADGRVGEILVEISAGHPDLDHAAIDAVRQWRFEPARRGAEPVASWVLLPVEFHLQ